MKVKRSNIAPPTIPTASMADIAFLLIIFFMVTSVYPIDKTSMELPETIDSYHKNYPEDAAVISISTLALATLRNEHDSRVEQLPTQDPGDEVIIKVSDGTVETQQIFTHRLADWDMSDPDQFDSLKTQLRNEFIDKLEIRRGTDSKRKWILTVIKLDRALPFKVLDGVIEVLQEVGGEEVTRGGLAVLTQLQG